MALKKSALKSWVQNQYLSFGRVDEKMSSEAE
jgi:hypothetical protein